MWFKTTAHSIWGQGVFYRNHGKPEKKAEEICTALGQHLPRHLHSTVAVLSGAATLFGSCMVFGGKSHKPILPAH
jgi:hypothetical protein